MKHILQGLLPLILLLAGCGDERVVKVAREADDRQAKQNEQIARVVNEETAFRQQAAKLQNDLRADQAVIAQQRDQLEIERKQLAGQREWAAFYTPLLETIGVVAVVVAILVYCSFVLVYGLRRGSASHEITELLVQDITMDQPTLPWASAGNSLLRLPHSAVPHPGVSIDES